MTIYKILIAGCMLFGSFVSCNAQDLATPAAPAAAPSSDTNLPAEKESERWNLFYQATSIGDYHGAFTAPYTGPLSLRPYAERDVSLTSTLFFTARVERNTFLIFDGELAGGKGFSGVNGFGDPSNGEIPRVASATPKPYIARLYIQHDFAFGKKTEHQESDENQLAGERPVNRYTVYAGRFTLTDFFDDNNYSHDPRTQFLAWGVMYNGAWDYPADTRGYTWGIVHELNTQHWAFRYGIVAEPKVANASQFDRRLFRDHGQTWEAERRYSLRKRSGAIRVLGYDNRELGGSYAQAIKLAAQTGATPDVTLSSRVGTLKYGFGVSFDQAINSDVGVFARLGWNDGKTETWAFTPIDRIAGGGVSVKGTRWHRKSDVVATSFTANGLSAVHREYLADGGLDFNLGDGKLNYSPEYLWESFYSARVVPGLFATFDVQRYWDPGYNHDRGPVTVCSVRLHMAFGLKPWLRQ